MLDQHAMVAEEMRVGQRAQHALIGVDAVEEQRLDIEVLEDALSRARPVQSGLRLRAGCASPRAAAEHARALTFSTGDRAFFAGPTWLERLPLAFRALLLAQNSPGLAVADLGPIG